jgi:hypothetical protein
MNFKTITFYKLIILLLVTSSPTSIIDASSLTPITELESPKFVKTATKIPVPINGREGHELFISPTYRSFHPSLGFGVPQISLGYRYATKEDVDWYVALGIGMGGSELSSPIGLIGDGGFGYIRSATLFTLGLGGRWTFPNSDSFLDATFDINGIGGESKTASLVGYSIGMKYGNAYSLSENVILSPYIGMSFDMMLYASVNGKAGRLEDGYFGIGAIAGCELAYNF